MAAEKMEEEYAGFSGLTETVSLVSRWTAGRRLHILPTETPFDTQMARCHRVIARRCHLKNFIVLCVDLEGATDSAV